MVYSNQRMILWFILSFQAGYANTGGFLAVHRFVSHVTGFATYVGIEGQKGDLLGVLSMLSAPCFFILGSMISSFFVDRKRLKKRIPSYFTAMFCVAFCFFLVGFLGVMGYFGKFGAPLDIYQDYFILVFLCMACGLQNAIITSVSGTVVRTTHLTGISTDLGIGLMRVLLAKLHGDDSYHKEIKANWLRSGLIAFFILGATIGAMFFMQFQYAGFFVPVSISLYVAVRLHVLERENMSQV